MNKIQFFGKVSDIMGSQIEFSIPEEGMSVRELRNKLADQLNSQDLLDIRNRISANDEIVDETKTLYPKDNIAMLSPFSGG